MCNDFTALLAARAWGQAVELLVSEHRRQVLRYARAVLANAESAADIVQDWSEAMLRAIPGFRGESSPKTWAYSIARNLVRVRLRRYSRRKQVALTTSRLVDIPQPSHSSEHHRQARLERTLSLLAQLPPSDREILALRTQRELSHKEVADLLGLSEAGARKRYQLAKDKLIRLHQANYPQSEDTSL